MAEKIQKSEQQRLGLQGSGRSGAKSDYKPFVPGPNPELPDFIKQHSTPYDPKTDKYDVKAFERDIVVDKAAPPKAIYDMHTYWSKKHWAAIREYIRHYLPKIYYPEGTGLVLDCFSGSGMTGVAAMMEDRPCVLLDTSPAAAFISHCYTHPVNPDELRTAYERLLTEPYPSDLQKKLKAATGEDIRTLQQELDWLYTTKCDRCGGHAITEYVVYSERFQCPKCGHLVPLFDCPEVKVPYQVGSRAKQKTELKKRRVCPQCLAKHKEPHRDFVVSTRTKQFGPVPVLVHYHCKAGCKEPNGERRHDEPSQTRKAHFFTDEDQAKLKHIDRSEIPHWYPHRKMMDVEDDKQPWGDNWRPGRNFRTIADLYAKRNLWALAALVSASKRLAVGDSFRIAVLGMVLGASRMNRYVPGHWSLQNRIMAGTYYIPQISAAVNIHPQFENRCQSVERANEALIGHTAIQPVVSNVSILKEHLQAPVDFIFTDPPYVGKIQYGELNFVWESWLSYDGAWLKDEIVVNEFRGKTLNDWDRDLRIALSKCYSALKPGRWLALCYHDTDADTWARIQNALLDTGFDIHTVTVLDPKQKSLNQLFAEKVVKSDLVLNCRKPRPGEHQQEGNSGETGHVSRRVREILVDTLSTLGGQTRDRLWDTTLKRLLTRGQMAEHRFDDILAEVAIRSESGRWFLKEEFEALSESDLRNEEEAGNALERFIHFRCIGVPVAIAAQLALNRSVADDTDDAVEKHIKREVLAGPEAHSFKLGGRMKGCEFYDCLFFYLTRYLKGRSAGRTPRRNLAEFLEEYVVRFRDGDKWLYRQPTSAEADSLKKSRQSGLGRRVRQFAAYLAGEGDFPKERMPDAKTMVAWLKHCANFGLAEAGVALYEKGGLMGQLQQLTEDERYDAEEYYATCRRNAGKKADDDEEAATQTDEEGKES